MTESESLATAVDRARSYTQWYFNKLQDSDIHHRFELNDRKLNSAYWLFAHVVMSENWLILNGTGGEMERFSWAKLFGIGKNPPLPSDCPPIEEILNTGSRIHSKAVERITALTSEELDAPHKVGFSIGGEGTCRDAILHAIRHEAGHAGQLGILCSVQGISTI